MRTLLLVLCAWTLGCGNKPTEEDCKKAIANIQKVTGVQPNTEEETLAAIRKCRGQSTKGAAECMANAKTTDEIDACEAKKK